MKKILLILFGVLFVSGAYSAQIANVEYVHKMIEQTWDITVPYNNALNSVKQIANMKYLLSTIDVANHMLNGSATTDYGNGEFATLQVADTDTVNTAVETLVTDNGGRNYKFFITTTSNTTSFKFYLSAAGEFYVDWGDGTRNKITRTNTQNLEYSHNYSTAGTYTIKIGGKATAYNTSATTAAIGFANSYYYADNIASIDGSLGAIFGTLSDGTQPRYYQTFYGAHNMTGSIPANLFAGISGAPASSMFSGTFHGCSGLTGAIPDGLFAGISGTPASSMFYNTFYGCSGLTSIPDGLFAGISGAPASSMFSNTFNGCSGLTSIPDGLFGNLTGAPASDMFHRTFSGCSGLTGAIPDGLFGNLTGAPASYMFYQTFNGCSGLTGSIPDGLFGNLTGAPASYMFFSTFRGCSKLTSIPENLFGNISGTAQDSMFNGTFYNCTSLTGPSARINGQYLYKIWPSATWSQVANMYYNATHLSDYSSIPSAWK